MRRKIPAVLAVCLAATTLLFAFLWQREVRSHDETRALAQAGAADAYAHFAAYQETGEESDYWYGVAAFRSFAQAYHLLVEGTNKDTNYLFCNEVYGQLVLSPGDGRAHSSELVAVMEILAQDVEDENGYLRMSELRNLLLHDE